MALDQDDHLSDEQQPGDRHAAAEALVTYDPSLAKPEDLIAAVGNAEGVNPYSATVKVKKR